VESIKGFSKLNKEKKIDWLAAQLDEKSRADLLSIKEFWHNDLSVQNIFDEFSENTISNFYMPYGIAPNFKINGKMFSVPMVIEESSVVAAASSAAKFWQNKGGFKAKVISTHKLGHVHFIFTGSHHDLKNRFILHKDELLNTIEPLTQNMKKRGGGLLSLDLIDNTREMRDYFKLEAKFETCDAMGANFINTVLEALAKKWSSLHQSYGDQDKIEIVMSILSNYTPECLVKAWVNAPLEEVGDFATKFIRAVKISQIDVTRAVTHNKGIFNGIDAVILATGNDFRATSACGHAYASRSGRYRGLTNAYIKEDQFYFELEIPLALGTVGGLTSLHPMAKATLSILNKPNAKELMEIVASVGLAQNFAAIKSLVTTGIQKGHMKMHLLNILKQLNATENEVESAKEYFQSKVISYSEVRNFIQSKRVVQ
jgi:hydroxymethylglutaryl-CoA reductase